MRHGVSRSRDLIDQSICELDLPLYFNGLPNLAACRRVEDRRGKGNSGNGEGYKTNCPPRIGTTYADRPASAPGGIGEAVYTAATIPRASCGALVSNESFVIAFSSNKSAGRMEHRRIKFAVV